MKRTENILIEDSDYELLQKVLPDNPCDRCSLGMACCGCPEGRDYSEKVKPYKGAPRRFCGEFFMSGRI